MSKVSSFSIKFQKALVGKESVLKKDPTLDIIAINASIFERIYISSTIISLIRYKILLLI